MQQPNVRPALALVINSLDGGGAEKQLLLAAGGLARAGFPCAIFTLQTRPPHPRLASLVAQAREAGVEFHEAAPGTIAWWRQGCLIRAWLGRCRDSLLWTWGYRADLLGLGLRASFVPFRHIGSLRDADEGSIRRRRLLWRLIFRSLTACVSNSHRNVAQIEAVVPGAMRKCRVIYNGLEAGLLSAPPPRGEQRPARLRVVMLGNLLLHKKGYDLAVELAMRIHSARLPFEILIGGRPVEGAVLREMIARRGVEPVIRLVGLVSEPRAFLSSGDVFLMLSRHEGTPNALLEAMALDLPAVCTRVGDVAAFARDGEQLRLVDVGDVSAALAALVSLWEDWPTAQVMGRAGGRCCRELFSEERMVRETVQFFNTLAPGKTP